LRDVLDLALAAAIAMLHSAITVRSRTMAQTVACALHSVASRYRFAAVDQIAAGAMW
jgi:hypothetical protein